MSPSEIAAEVLAADPAPVKNGSKTEYRSGDPAKIKLEIVAPTFEDKYEERKFLKHRLVLAYRIFAQHNLTESVAGHITLRDPVDPTSFWVNPFGLNFALIEDDDLIRVSEEGEVIDGGRNRFLNAAAFAIHSELHKARPDVMCAAHSHTIYGRAFSATGRTLDMLSQDFCSFYNDHVLYPNFAGLVLANEEGRAIAAALGSKKAAILGNHGLLTVGSTIESCVAWFVGLERLCQIQLIADAAQAGRPEAGPLVVIGEEEAQVTYEAVGTEKAGYFIGLPLFQVAERELGEKTYLGQGMIKL